MKKADGTAGAVRLPQAWRCLSGFNNATENRLLRRTAMSGNFNAELYLASNPDVLNALGLNLEAAREHYEEHGVYEGRREDFDAEDYLAANPDLITAFHNDTTQALHHYLEHGYAEGRKTDFNAKEYLAANRDVLEATGGDENAATQHYVEHGWREGRSTDFNEKEYLAANKDLLNAFGKNYDEALKHYLEHGYEEGRSTDFNESKYLEANNDIKSVYGDDLEGALEHYLEHGCDEGREVEVHTGEDGGDDDHGTVTTVTTTTTTTTGGEATVSGTDAADTYVATGSVRFEGRGGADQLKLSERGGSDKVVFSAAGDGASAGSKYGFDQIKNFQSGADKVIISGSLLSLTDHNGDGALTAVSRNKNSISGGDELVFFSAEVDDLNGDGMSRIARALGSVTGAGDVLVAATHEGESALYLVQARGGALAGSDIRMLGLFKDSALLSGNIIAG
jgi:hypothetical protein